MSVRTTSDELRDQAKEHIETAHKEITFAFNKLREAAEPDTWGADSYSDDYDKVLEDIPFELLTIERELRKQIRRI